MAQSENNWLGMARWPPEGDQTPKRCNGICVNFYLRTTPRKTFISKNIGSHSYQNRQFTFPSETTSISVILIWESHPTSQRPYSKRISKTEMTETTNLFSPATSWNQHPRAPHTSATLPISEDVTTPIYIFNILNTYIFINLSFKLFFYLIYLSYSFIYLLFSAVRHPPSAGRCSTLYRVLRFCRKWYAVQLNIVYVGPESLRFWQRKGPI